MDIWEQGVALGVNNNEYNKLYGREYWDEFIATHDYYFVEFSKSIKPFLVPMGYFQSPEQVNYLKYQNKFGYNGDFDEYKTLCIHTNNILQDFNYKFFNARHNTIFKAKEFGQFCILIKELYEHGAFNYPNWKITISNNNTTINSHPGQHLNFARMYLGMPLKGFVSVLKTNTSTFDFLKENAKIINHIKTDEDIIAILGTNKIAACIQNYGDQLVPSLYPSIPRPVWAGYDANGNTDWPWQDAANFYGYLESTKYVGVIDEVANAVRPTTALRSYVEVHNNFKGDALVNNFMAFLLTEKHTDNNFTWKVIK